MSTADPSIVHDAAGFSRTVPEEQRVGKEVWLYAGLGGILLGFLSLPVFVQLSDLWRTREDYSHGFLVPLICLYLIRMKWDGIRHLPVKPAPLAGMSVLSLSLAGLLGGMAGNVITVSSVSWIGVLTGLVLLLFGYRHLQHIAFPLAYLVFMTPFLDVIVEPLQSLLQKITAAVVSALFEGAGVPTYLDDTTIQFPNGVLEVAVECSGAGFLISALAIGLPLAMLVLRSWWNRAALLLIALLVSILANWMRVTVISLIGYLSGWGPQVHGPLHLLQGMLVYWVGFGVLFAGAWILAKRERGGMNAGTGERFNGDSSTSVLPGSTPAWRTWRRVWWLALVTVAGAAVWLYGYDRGPVSARHPLASLPVTIGEWQAQEELQATPLVKIAGADDELMRVYRRADGAAVHLYIAYLNSQMQGKELVNYLTAPLHKGAEQSMIPVGQDTVPVNVGFWTDHRTRTPVLFWYAVDGRILSGRYETKLTSIAQALMHRGSNGAFVLIAGGGGEDEAAAAHMEPFAQALIPLLRHQWP